MASIGDFTGGGWSPPPVNNPLSGIVGGGGGGSIGGMQVPSMPAWMSGGLGGGVAGAVGGGVGGGSPAWMSDGLGGMSASLGDPSGQWSEPALTPSDMGRLANYVPYVSPVLNALQIKGGVNGALDTFKQNVGNDPVSQALSRGAAWDHQNIPQTPPWLGGSGGGYVPPGVSKPSGAAAASGGGGGGGGSGGNGVLDKLAKADPMTSAPKYGTDPNNLHEWSPAAPSQVGVPTTAGLGLSRASIAGPGTMTDASGTVLSAGGVFGGQQNTLASHLLDQATNPNAPSIAALQLQQGQQANLAQQFAMANSARGGQQSLALRSAMQNAGQINGGLSSQAAMARLAEQQQAAGMAGNVIQSGRGQSLEQGINAAGLQQDALRQTYGAGLQTNLAQGGLDQGYNQSLLGVGGLGVQAGTANQNAGIQTQGLDLSGTKMHNDNLVQLYGIKNGLIGNSLMAAGTGLAGLASILKGSGVTPPPVPVPAGGGGTTTAADGTETAPPTTEGGNTDVGSETANSGYGDSANDAGSYNSMGLNLMPSGYGGNVPPSGGYGGRAPVVSGGGGAVVHPSYYMPAMARGSVGGQLVGGGGPAIQPMLHPMAQPVYNPAATDSSYNYQGPAFSMM